MTTLSDRDKYDLPSTPRAEYIAVAPDLQLVRDLLGGTRTMWRRFATYIPKFDSEPPARHKIRAQVATVYGGLSRALSACTGMLFAKPPAKEQADSTKETPKKWPEPILRHYENLDGKGTGGDVLLKRRARDAMGDGFCAILIEHPKAPADVVVTEENQDELNLRPIWVSYTRADVISWVTAVINNVETLVQVVLREETSQPIGRFGVVPVVRYRVCHLSYMRDPMSTDPQGAPQLIAWWEVVEEKKDDSGNISVVRVDGPGVFRDRVGAPFDEIPLAVPSAVNSDAIFTGDPPFIALAWANLEHWQIASELRWYNRLSAYPQPVVEGELVSDSPSADGTIIKPTLKLGPTTVVNLKVGSKFSYAEVSGRSSATLETELARKKDEMAELGASFLSKKTRGVETAEAKRIDAAAENATLSTAGQGIEDGFNEALRLHARYLGIPAQSAPTVKINRDFEGILMDAPVMLAYVQLVLAGYPKRLVLEAFQVGGRIPDEADLDKLEMQWEAEVQAAQDQQAIDAQQQRQQNAPAPRTRRTNIERDANNRPVALVTQES